MNKNQQEDAKKERNKYLKENLAKIHNKIIILSGKGGVGKSTVAVNVAFDLAKKGKKVGILDVDIHGPSTAKLLGIEGQVLKSNKKGDIEPIKVTENLYAITIATMLKSPDDPIIWRGPLKMGAIKQFMGELRWPELDYLIVDSPPGTGDEPLSVVQILGDVDGSLIVTTPQDLALLDARKTINFSNKMNVDVLGIVENMTTFKCPHCGKPIDIFKGTGVNKAAKDFNLDILGKIPVDPNISSTGDKGKSYFLENAEQDSSKEFAKITKAIRKKLG
ncbi:MAG: Mrp/NBP35 family ATP-binding protein [Candidatus Cloacimonetes bacterium]|nr:Mrp/NBP35 family ATP-binding protein [Candidatus Cloacimonadota bacterium]MBS3766658.1 Mrp/NBP35 family ATP-binding protein [Candidatus Cloacimonadota bacterium]